MEHHSARTAPHRRPYQPSCPHSLRTLVPRAIQKFVNHEQATARASSRPRRVHARAHVHDCRTKRLDLNFSVKKHEAVPNQEDLTLGKTILAALRARGLTQAALAKKMGKTRSTIHAWCHDKAQPRLNTVSQIANALDTTVAELLAGRWRRARTPATEPAPRELMD